MKPSNFIEPDTKLWLPPLTQRNQKEAAIMQGIKASEAENELWVPSIAPKEQKETSRKNKVKGTTRSPRRRPRLNLRLAGGTYRRLGFKGKTVWDWLPLLLLLMVVVSIFLSVSRFITLQRVQQDRLVQQIATPEASVIAQIGGLVDQEHEQNLASYLDRISSLLVSRTTPLLQSRPGSLERTLAQARTTDILNSFSSDSPRKAIVLQFLHDVGLIQVNTGAIKGPIISLTAANLVGLTLIQANLASVNLDGANLSNATLTNAILTSSSLHGATLIKAKFMSANLTGADLSGAHLEGADFTGARLEGVNLTGAHLKGANLSGADIKGAKLKGATF